jgi:hypothetical protein
VQSGPAHVRLAQQRLPCLVVHGRVDRPAQVRQCLGTVLNETFAHHGFCVRDLDLIEAQDAK